MQEKWLYGIIGLLAGILIAFLFASNAVNNNNQGMMRMMGMRIDNQEEMMEEESMMVDEMHKEDMSMNEMVNELKGKTEDEFDKAFILGMIVHHQGAIEMANLASQSAKHEELKSMAGDIISAQSKEIEMMKSWQKDWSY